MPGLNRKGPLGEGAMTGRKLGRCNPDNKGKTDEEIVRDREQQQQGQVKTEDQRLGFGRRFLKRLGLNRGLKIRTQGSDNSNSYGQGRGMGRGRGIGQGRAAGQGRGMGRRFGGNS